MTSPLEVSKFRIPYFELTQPIDSMINIFSQLWIYIFILAIACVLYFSKPKKSSLMKGG